MTNITYTMRKYLIVISLLLIPLLNFSQQSNSDSLSSGQPHFKVFWNYNYDFTEGATRISAFELSRVYLGYKYSFNDNICAKITYDIGENEAGSSHTAFLKIAQLDWELDPNVKLSLGMIRGKQFDDQEKIWGYRYLYKTLQDEYKFGSSADLGINVELKISNKLVTNLFIVNGEGYKDIQSEDGNQRFGANLIYKPNGKIISKFYYDTHAILNSKSINNLGIFIGFNSAKFRFGAEYNKMQNAESYKLAAENHNLEGISLYGSYAINDKLELFIRYDKLSSNNTDDNIINWNYENDGSLNMIGIQYSSVKGVKFSLNSRNFNFNDNNISDSTLIYFNAEFKL
jgi:hypothetical protein